MMRTRTFNVTRTLLRRVVYDTVSILIRGFHRFSLPCDTFFYFSPFSIAQKVVLTTRSRGRDNEIEINNIVISSI